jgi:DNA-binding CsgD family transcriptional regulator
VPPSQVIDELLYAQALLLGRVVTHLSERHLILRTLIAERDALDAGSSTSMQAWPLATDDRTGLYDAPTRADADIAAIHPGGQFSPDLLQRSLARAEASLARGVRLRVIHQNAALQHPGQVRYMQAIEDLGGRVRVRDNLPFRLLLSDGAAAVCSVADQVGDTDTFLLRGNQMVTMLERVFEATWVDAVPLSTATGQSGLARDTATISGLSGQQESILRLLGEGQTDQAIARQLGITTRTVTRRIGEIYESLGVDSRFQAGVAAQRLGLV